MKATVLSDASNTYDSNYTFNEDKKIIYTSILLLFSIVSYEIK